MIVQMFWGSDNLGEYQKYVDMNKDKLKSNWKLYTHSEMLELFGNKYPFLNDPEFRKQGMFQMDFLSLLLMKEVGNGIYIELDNQFLVDTIQLEEEVNNIYKGDIFISDMDDEYPKPIKFVGLWFYKVTKNSEALEYLINYYLERKYELKMDIDMLGPDILSQLSKLNCKLIPAEALHYLIKELSQSESNLPLEIAVNILRGKRMNLSRKLKNLT
jgi:hypothetical protein